jgi:hypothetical protein
MQRKIDNSDNRAKKRVKAADGERKVSKKIAKATSTKTPKKKRGDSFASSDAAMPSSDRRRSGRATIQKSYIESSDEERLDDVIENGDEEMADASEAESELTPAPEAEAELSPEAEVEQALPIRKGRGKPKKAEPVVEEAEVEEEEPAVQEAQPSPPARKGRSRAKKAEPVAEEAEEDELDIPEQKSSPPVKKRRGRAKKAEPVVEEAEEQEDEPAVQEPSPKATGSPRSTRKRVEAPVVEVLDDERSSSLSEEEEKSDSPPPPKSASRKKSTPQRPSAKKSNGSTTKKEKVEKVVVKAKTPVRPVAKAKGARKGVENKTNGRATRGQKGKEGGVFDVPSDSE